MGIIDKLKQKKNLDNMSETAKNMVEALKYPYQYFHKNTPQDTIIKAYEKAFERGTKEGFTPVMVPVDGILEEYFGIVEEDRYSVDEVLQAQVGSGKKILEERFDEYFCDEMEDGSMDEFIGEYDDEPEVMNGYSSLRDFSTGETNEVILYEVPTKNPWELVAYIPFGGWNECPNPDEMTAICKYWYEAYGAIPTIITHDVLEMRLPKPVDEKMALEVAKEHYAFTPDRVDQGTATGTLSEVAASIAVSKGWFFWWD